MPANASYAGFAGIFFSSIRTDYQMLTFLKGLLKTVC
jgi:hypothetical protein